MTISELPVVRIIDDNDVHPIGHSSSVPEIYYGLKLGFEYKGFGLDALFQGVADYSRMMNVSSVYWPLTPMYPTGICTTKSGGRRKRETSPMYRV